MHSSVPACSGCHVLFDPAGFALESFDEVGRFRTMDHGKPVDSSGTMALQSDIDGPFATGEELLARMADSRDIKVCFAEQYLKHALAREQLVADDACSARALGESFAENGDLRGLVAALVTTDAFLMRFAEGVD
jgi:hypothetical protein